MRDLAARLRSIVKQDAGRPRPAVESSSLRELTYVADLEGGRDVARTAADLGGVVHSSESSACVAIDRLWPYEAWHGRKQIQACALDAESPIALFDPRLAAHSAWADRAVFFDVETTGLSGGAGTLAFRRRLRVVWRGRLSRPAVLSERTCG